MRTSHGVRRGDVEADPDGPQRPHDAGGVERDRPGVGRGRGGGVPRRARAGLVRRRVRRGGAGHPGARAAARRRAGDRAPSHRRGLGVAPSLPELAAVPWRPRVTDRSLERRNQLWTLTTIGHVVPFVAVAVGLVLLPPLAPPLSLIALAKAWIVPALYAQRGANVVRPRHPGSGRAERRALGLLGDLMGHDARELHN